MTPRKLLFSRLPYTFLCSIIFKEKSFVGMPVGKMQTVREVMKSHSIQGKRRIKEYKMSYIWEYNIWKICNSFFLAVDKRVWVHHVTFVCYNLYMYVSVCCFWLFFFLMELVLEYCLETNHSTGTLRKKRVYLPPHFQFPRDNYFQLFYFFGYLPPSL